jgi:hypothetical protein
MLGFFFQLMSVFINQCQAKAMQGRDNSRIWVVDLQVYAHPPSSYLTDKIRELRSPYGQLKSKCIIRYSKYLGAGCIRISIIYWHHLIYFTPCRSSKSLKTDRRSQVPALALVSFVWLLEFQFSSMFLGALAFFFLFYICLKFGHRS